MTLIDTPGFNDTNVTRTDKSILNELIKIIRPMLYDSNKGITSFIQCIMPDESDRIRATSIKAMNTMLFILNSFDPRTDITNHPRIILIFNNVSLYSNDTSPEDIRQQKKQAFRNNTELKSQETRVYHYLYDLKEIAKKFYLKEDTSELTKFGSKNWFELKHEVCANDQYLQATWFKDLEDDDRELVTALREI